MSRLGLAGKIRELYESLREEKRRKFDRSLSFGDYFTDRWERARFEGFGEGTSVYDSVLIIGDVRIGEHCWIGPNCLLDGSGGLEIGDYCSISSGVQIYSHHTVAWTTSMGEREPERERTTIGSGVFIGPSAIIQMGCSLGDRSVIGALSFVNRSVPAGARAYGTPAKILDERGQRAGLPRASSRRTR